MRVRRMPRERRDAGVVRAQYVRRTRYRGGGGRRRRRLGGSGDGAQVPEAELCVIAAAREQTRGAAGLAEPREFRPAHNHNSTSHFITLTIIPPYTERLRILRILSYRAIILCCQREWERMRSAPVARVR